MRRWEEVGGVRVIGIKDVFFFKQKEGFEVSACLVGSGECIRDRSTPGGVCKSWVQLGGAPQLIEFSSGPFYTSDAADE